ncbi:MAG: phosphate ABC transporter permease subunit PstC [Ignavibacteriae bacterium HGW-Ignavibacteriae-2]|jgi:phosphate transport system permease protein|nr:phosphate ABC transporter permease subunit PstC [Bacteroidota bacterium]PKL90169.1 MAG: phosphate ABC transporter permease subunit PstC [Ignavibacteriae bacterium HGW-Ignavibacteriae-2]
MLPESNNELLKTSTVLNKKNFIEKSFEYFLKINGIIAGALILFIFLFMINEAVQVLNYITPENLLYIKLDNKSAGDIFSFDWSPTSNPPKYSILPLLLGSFLTAIPACLISAFLGLILGVYLSEIASAFSRNLIKPVIEVFTGIPTVVVGFITLVVAANFIQDVFGTVSRLNALLAAFGLSTIVIPIIASLTDDALRSIPEDIRMASYALGASKWQTISTVLIPTAINGISASVLIGFSRAIGETMIVLMVSGNAAVISVDLFGSVRTISATIAAELGQVSINSQHYYALFFIGFLLFVFTLLINLLAELMLDKMKRKVNI